MPGRLTARKQTIAIPANTQSNQSGNMKKNGILRMIVTQRDPIPQKPP